jgi:hypothetical protein
MTAAARVVRSDRPISLPMLDVPGWCEKYRLPKAIAESSNEDRECVFGSSPLCEPRSPRRQSLVALPVGPARIEPLKPNRTAR